VDAADSTQTTRWRQPHELEPGDLLTGRLRQRDDHPTDFDSRYEDAIVVFTGERIGSVSTVRVEVVDREGAFRSEPIIWWHSVEVAHEHRRVDVLRAGAARQITGLTNRLSVASATLSPAEQLEISLDLARLRALSEELHTGVGGAASGRARRERD
jgi:hypothetical protein